MPQSSERSVSRQRSASIFQGAAAQESERSVQFGKADPCDLAYVTNRVVTSKYTWTTFLPVNAWEQLHKFGNVYFLLISIIMYLGEKTPLFVGTIKAFSTLGLLMIMMSITAAMCLFDDLRRKKADAEINALSAQVVERRSNGNIDQVRKSWEDVHVGDILIIRRDEEFPADAVPLFCSGEGGNCYVSTANLDGETNLKLKTAPTATQSLFTLKGTEALNWNKDVLGSVSGILRAEAPNTNIHDFNGNLEVRSGSPVSKTKESLGARQLLMRGTALRNTAFCVCVVVYTGTDTRMIRNSRPAPMKQSNLERITNSAMLIILCVQALLAIVSTILHMQFQPSLKEHWYIYPTKILLPEALGWWLTFFTLYSNLMPISLYPTAEFCNAWQCYFIRNDRYMYYKQADFNHGAGFPAAARTSNLCQELGQVGYIFSDKTGTLTQNDMELKIMSVANRTYGSFEQGDRGFNGTAEIQDARRTGSATQQPIDRFMEALSVAHTALAITGKDGRREYEAESPDEFALVTAAAEQGWEFTHRKGREIFVSVSPPPGASPNSPSSQRRSERYIVIATNEFNSTRKRMSVLVQTGSTYWLFVKGADNVMLERAAGKHPKLLQDLKEFSLQGLRTLVIGSRMIPQAELKPWLERFEAAQRSVNDREAKLMEVAEVLEQNLEILGATAIEDKLQDGVPDTIVKIRAAGIKLWVLTGDKLETARNIGFSTKVLTPSMDLQIIDEEEGTLELSEIAERWASRAKKDVDRRGLMVTGKSLSVLMSSSEDMKEEFLEVAQGCAVLIACRVSPAQKAELVRLIRTGVEPAPVTLSVGDGANDVPMIQEAQVGVGIAGREGRQAVNNSDFAIAQFRHLERLLFVHGRWNYRRACTFTHFTFWRNMVQVLMMMYYTWMSGFSGTALYEDWIRLSFNVLCTLPILAVGVLDQDVDADVALANPKLYDIGRNGDDLNMAKTMQTVVAAFTHSLVLLGMAIPSFPGLEVFGYGDYYTFGTVCYTCLLTTVNYRAAYRTYLHSGYTAAAILASFVGYAFWLWLYPCHEVIANMLAPNMYGVTAHMVQAIYFWLCIILTPMFAMVVDVFFHFLFHHFFPDVVDKVLEQQRRGSRAHLLVEEDEKEKHKYRQEPPNDHEIDESAFGQQELKDTFRFSQFTILESPCARVVLTGLGSGTIMLLVGALCLFKSTDVQQVRINYTQNAKPRYLLFEDIWLNNPYGTMPDELANISCIAEFGGIAQTCRKTIKFPRGMKTPLLMYNVGPFYQNYNAYMRSEVISELFGKEVPQSLRDSQCVEPTRVRMDNGTARQIIPCGMKATSFFNDSYEIFFNGRRLEIDTKRTAWASDVERYNNPLDYPWEGAVDPADKLFLFEEYPGVIRRQDGVKDEAFANWMRPSSVPRVWNRYGILSEVFEPGDSIEVVIHSRFPMGRISGGFKEFIITEHTVFGARHNLFAYVVMFAGALSYLFAATAYIIVWCSRDQNEYETDDSDNGDETEEQE